VPCCRHSSTEILFLTENHNRNQAVRKVQRHFKKNIVRCTQTLLFTHACINDIYPELKITQISLQNLPTLDSNAGAGAKKLANLTQFVLQVELNLMG